MRTWTLLIILILAACGQKGDISKEETSKGLCDCFNSKTTGSIDNRLTSCLQEIIDERQNNLSVTTDNLDTIKKELNKFNLDLMILMTRTCDSYFSEINKIYDNGYPLDSSAVNNQEIDLLTKRIESATNQDSIKSLLHKKVYKLIQARQYTLALENLANIKTLDKDDYGANLASAYIFNQLDMYDKAIAEIEKAISLSDNLNLVLYSEIAKRKKELTLIQ